MTFGERVKEIRIEKGMSQADLAVRMAVTQQSIGKYEGLVLPPKYATIIKISKGLGVAPEEMLSPTILNSTRHGQRVTSDVDLAEDPQKTTYSDNQNARSDAEWKKGSRPKKASADTNQKLMHFNYECDVLPEEYSDYYKMLEQFTSLNGQGRQKVLAYMQDISPTYGKNDL